MNVFRARLDAHQNDALSSGFQRFGLIRGEDDLAAGGTGRGRQAGGNDLALCLGVDGGVQQLVECCRIDAGDRLFLRDQASVRHFDSNAQRRFRGALAAARLQHPELAAFDGEFEILHVAIMLFEQMRDADELMVDVGHDRLHRRLVGMGTDTRPLGDVLRRANAGHHILALRIDEELAIELMLAGRGIAREGDARGRGLAHIAKHHGLHIDRRAPRGRNVIELAIGDGALVHPRAEHGTDGTPELFMRILREWLAGGRLHLGLIARNHDRPVGGREISVEHVIVVILELLKNLFEFMMIYVEYDIRIHLDEAAVGIIGKALVAGASGDGIHCRIIQAEVENRVHHARHRGAGPRAHRDEQRVSRIAESAAGDRADMFQRGLDGGLEFVGILATVIVEIGTDFGGDGEAGRNGQAEIGHFRQICALAAQQIAHTTVAFGRAITEGINPFRHCHWSLAGVNRGTGPNKQTFSRLWAGIDQFTKWLPALLAHVHGQDLRRKP